LLIAVLLSASSAQLLIPQCLRSVFHAALLSFKR